MICPNCKRDTMHKNGSKQGKQNWICYAERSLEGYRGRPGQNAVEKRKICYTTINPKALRRGQNGKPKDAQFADPVFKRQLNPKAKSYLITSAQNATPVHAKFWSCLQTARMTLDAELLVIPIRYKNPTSRFNKKEIEELEHDEWWDPKCTPFLWNARKAINKNLMLLADIKTQATSSDPLTGYDAISGGSSAIVGHTKMSLRVIPTPQNRMPKILTTTGSCTKPNYSDTKAGKMGEFHHSLSALIVEVDGSKFHLRQIHYDQKSGSFTDLDARYFPDGLVSKAPRPEALIMGDTHLDFIDAKVEKATFGAKGMIAQLKPKRLVWHDLLDGYSVNPHHKGNVFNSIAKIKGNRSNVEAEVKRAINFVVDRTVEGIESLVIPSNHNDFLTRWLVDTDPRSVPGNFEFWCETALAMAKATTIDAGGTAYPEPFSYWGRKLTADHGRIKFLARDESLLIAGVELSMHGDRGPNGARGSARNLRRIGVRSVIGHSHTPGIEEGCYQVGTSTPLKLEYTYGPSSWLNTHCLLHADGKRQLIHIIDGNWRG